jgi:predicted nucleotidyltransferase
LGQRTDARIESFVERVRTKYQITQAIFFGSRAGGDYLVNSDYDIILVSPDFQGVFFSQRSALMYDFWTHWPLEIEPLCYTPEEFEKKKGQIGIVSEAIKEGVLL